MTRSGPSLVGSSKEGFTSSFLWGVRVPHPPHRDCQGELEIIGISQPVQTESLSIISLWVLCPEHKAVHGVLVQKNLADLPGIHGVLYIQVPFLQPFENQSE